MEKALLITLLLCLYGLFKEFRPVEPFLSNYLLAPPKNFTQDQLYGDIYPIWTYSYLVVLVPIFLLTDLLRYKPIIMLESIGYISTWVLLLWGTSVFSQQWMQAAYGVATATEIAYYAYIYPMVSPERYKQVTSFIRAAGLGGKAAAYGLSQLIISTRIGNYFTLNYLSLASMSLTLIIAIILPRVPRDTGLDSTATSYGQYVQTYFKTLWPKFKQSYRDTFVIKWSLWWALATCGFFQIGNYIQVLWVEIKPDEKDLYNGLVEFINTTLGTIVTLLTQLLTVRWEIFGELTIGFICCIDGILLGIMSQATQILESYAIYIIFRVLYQMSITIVTYNIAKRLITQSYGLVFGCNTFIALALQTALTYAVADEHGINLNIRTQFIIYGAYHAVIAVIFMIMGILTLVRHKRVKRWEVGTTTEESWMSITMIG